jgi:aspartate 1-decarboxylase
MYRSMLRSKIHRATVTGADLHYEGSVTIDADLMERADIVPHQEVAIWNVTNGERFHTYALPGKDGSGVVCINGAAAHKARTGDLVIIATFGWMADAEARSWKPRVVFVDARNRPLDRGGERAGQAQVSRVTWPPPAPPPAARRARLALVGPKERGQ